MPFDSFRARWCLCLSLFVIFVGGCNEDKIEKMIGGQVSRAIESSYQSVDHPALQEWLSNVGHTTVAMSTRQHIPYKFTVLDSDTVNAMAAPWGYIYFMRGILDFAEEEDEVWMVMGHEVGHVVNRDMIKAVKRTFLWNVGLTIINSKSESVAQALGIGLGLLSFHYSREDERDADKAGILYTYRAGRDPRAGPVFFTRLMQKYETHKPSKLEALLRTHPLTSSRIDAQKASPELDPRNAEALAHIGRGYVSRGRYMEGMKLLQQALQINPNLPSARLALANAAAKRGYLELAEQQLTAVNEALGYVPAISRQVQMVAATQPAQWPDYSPEERQQLASAIAEIDAHKHSLAAEQVATNQALGRLSEAVKPLSASATNLTDRLSKLADTDVQVTENLQNMLVSSNAVITQASDLVSRLEAIGDRVAAVQADTNAAAALLERAGKILSVSGPPAAAGWIKRSAHELSAALRDAAAAASFASIAVEPTRKALASCQDATVYMERLLALGENDLLMDLLKAATEAAEKQSAAAREAAKQARETAARAEARVAVARINLAAAGATPEELRALADIVSYFVRKPSERVMELLNQGAGLGEVAACLLAAPASSRSAADLLIAGLQGPGVIDSLHAAGASMAGTQIMLKFVAQAISKELPTGAHEAPRFTS